MTTIQNAIATLTETFVEQLLEVIRGGSLSDLIGAETGRAPRAGHLNGSSRVAAGLNGVSKGVKTEKAPRASGRLPRRSLETIQAAVGQVVAVLKTAKEGMRAEQIRSVLGLQSKEMPRILAEALATKAVVILAGQKRATTYGVRGAVKAAGKGPTKGKTKTKAAAKPKKAATRAKAKSAAKGKSKAAPKTKAKVKSASKSKAASKTKGSVKRSKGQLASKARPAAAAASSAPIDAAAAP